MAEFHSYPAIFREDIEDETGALSVSFPDLPGCFSCGDNLEEATAMAGDALWTMLDWFREEGKPFPVPTPAKDIKVKKYETVHIIRVNLATDDDLIPCPEETCNE